MSREVERTVPVPVPVSVTMYNLLVPPSRSNDATETTASSSVRNAWLRPEYTSELLIPVRLDIVLTTGASGQGSTALQSSNSIADEEGHAEDLILFSAPQDRGAVHPCWDHLDERSDFWDKRTESQQQSERDPVYRSLRLRIRPRMQHSAEGSTMADMPLHPALLRRLPEEHRDRREDLVAWEQRPPPRALPPNAVLVTFSDGSTRVNPQLYHLLLSERVIVESNLNDESLIQDETEENRRELRFSDDVFDKLNETVAWWDDTSPTIMKRKRSPSSLLETDDESQAVPVSPLRGDMDVYADDDTGDISVLSRGVSEIGGQSNATEEDKESSFDAKRNIVEEGKHVVDDLQQEVQTLEQMIQREQECLDKDLEASRRKGQLMTAILEEEKRIQQEILAIRLETDKTRLNKRTSEFLLVAQRMKLLKDLRSIYYIQSQPNHRYLIRDQEIPADPFGGIVPEEEVSAAMGFLCHSVVMISKYLSVPLPYRIIFNSSRSAIQGDSPSQIYPLFQARAVDRQQAVRGMELLTCNVSCILKLQGIRCSEELHILDKVMRIYNSVITGSDSSSNFAL